MTCSCHRFRSCEATAQVVKRCFHVVHGIGISGQLQCVKILRMSETRANSKNNRKRMRAKVSRIWVSFREFPPFLAFLKDLI